MCADELSSKREPYFPGNYEWAPGGEVGEGARSGRDGYTREGARTSRQKIFFPFLVASLGISFSLKHNPPPPPPRAATPRPPLSLLFVPVSLRARAFHAELRVFSRK